MMIRVARPLIAIVALISALSLIFFLLISMDEDRLSQVLTVLALGGIALLIVRYPYWGSILVVASLPLVDIVPSVPFTSSAVSLLGLVTFGVFFANRLRNRKERLVWSNVLAFGALFLTWLIVTNPAAAFLPSDDRVWAFTFFQLLLFAWLSAQLFDDPGKHRSLIWFFSGATLISAIFALSQGGIAESVQLSERAAGLAGGANSAARYFVVGLVLIYYLRSTTVNGLLRFILLVCMGIVVLGVLYTVSRTGLLLLAAAFGLILTLRVDGKRRVPVLMVLLLILSVVWLFADNIVAIFATILPSIRAGSDTVGLRYKLWEAGWRMWLDHPIQGVGIGQYVERLAYYGSDLLPPSKLRLGAHNMYVQVLSETGLVGAILLVVMLATSLHSLWKAGRSENLEIASLAQIWFIVMAIMLLGGLTKHDHYDKLLWITVGLSTSLFRIYQNNRVQTKTSY